MSNILNGRRAAAALIKRVKGSVAEFEKLYDTRPGLAVVLVGDRPDSAKYVAAKKRSAAKANINSFSINLPEDVDENELLKAVEDLGNDDRVDGVLVQLPLPDRLAHVQEKVLEAVSIDKDVDGFHPYNLGRLLREGEIARKERRPVDFDMAPCTPVGVMTLLKEFDLSGKHAVVVGRSNIVGLPLSLMLTHRDATVTNAHSRTSNLKDLISQADIVVAAVGIPKFIDDVKPGAVVIDVGINATDEGLVGDVDFDKVAPKCRAITPVPGGVGPMTVATLIEKTCTNAFKRRRSFLKGK